jgi:hypothetical protein
MAAVTPLYQDPFSPVLFSSPALVVSEEQKRYAREVLEIACSDTQFADKAYRALVHILTVGNTVVPVVSSLTPGSATVGDPDFTLHVHGTGFTSLSSIVFNGGVEPTVYVSATELTTGVSMATVTGASTIPVGVVSAEGVLSNVMSFVFQDVPIALSAKKSTPVTTATHDKNAHEVEKGKK